MSVTFVFRCDQCGTRAEREGGNDTLKHATEAGYILVRSGRWQVGWDLAFCSWGCVANYAQEQNA